MFKPRSKAVIEGMKQRGIGESSPEDAQMLLQPKIYSPTWTGKDGIVLNYRHPWVSKDGERGIQIAVSYAKINDIDRAHILTNAKALLEQKPIKRDQFWLDRNLFRRA